MNQAHSASLFGSREAFQSAFETGLDRLVQADDLNLFILVLANATFDTKLMDRLRPRLLERYLRLCEQRRASPKTGAVDADADDLQVFAQIAAIGIDKLGITRQRSAGPWEVQFNQLRSFRPLRNSRQPVNSIYEPFLEHGFHFNKPFIQQESIWSGQLLGQHIDLYYNKYPFVDTHALLVPERHACLPQFLSRDMHVYVWDLVQVLGVMIPGLRIGYNAFGAFASVNHLHLQMFVRNRPLPVQDPRWQHNGGGERYPVHCRVFDDPASAWSLIERLHEENHAYNLLYTAGLLYCLPRRKQGDFALAEWSNGLSWYEMCGGMITFDLETCLSLTRSGIESGLKLARLDDGWL